MSIESAVIAVGRDEGERADRFAEIGVELADAGAALTLVHVFETQAEVDEARDQIGLSDGSVADVVRRLDSVRRVKKALEEEGVTVDVDGRVGDPGDAVSAVVDEVGANRLVVGGRDRSPAGKAVFGSTAQDLLLSAPCPVTFVRRED
ncbi:MAG: universal stress protein [Halobaculum sp.]|jgi:nucleotide-binding universal stress UspA family protein